MKIRALLCLLLFWGLATGGGARAATADANPNAMNGGKYTALDYAVDRTPHWSEQPASNRALVVRALLEKGALKNRKPKDGVTPVERAKRSGNAEISALLAAR